MRTVLTALMTFSACQAVREKLRVPQQACEYGGGRVKLKPLWNEKAAFGLPIRLKTLLGVSAASLGLIWCQKKRSPVGVGLILGGGISNLWERLWNGRVYDYLQFPKAPKPLKRYVFNLADFAIFVGMFGWLIGRKKL